MNNFALYWTDLKGQSTGYRDVRGSVTIKSMQLDGQSEDLDKGICCKSMSDVLFFELPKGQEKNPLLKKRELAPEFRNQV